MEDHGKEHNSSSMGRDYSDLEPAAPHMNDAPEAVTDFHPRQPILQRSVSSSSPQVFTPPPGDQAPHYDYYGGQYDARPYYEPQKAPLSVNEREAEKHAINDSRRVKMCGLRPKVFFWIVGILVVVLVLAAVLAGVLVSQLGGSDLPNETSSKNATAALKVKAGSGLAAITPDGSSTLFQYYQDDQGRIIENQYDENGKWLIQGGNVPSYSVIGTDAQAGSPIAATSWVSSGTSFRGVFYLDSNGRVMSSNTTGVNPWPAPYSILPEDAAISGTKALAVCAGSDANALNGLRLYFASSDLRIIREVGLDFDENIWTLWQTFPGSDPFSGVATILANGWNHAYLVNSSTGALQQWTWDYANHKDATWAPGAKSTSYIADRSDIAVACDGISTDHIFYQGIDNKLVRALYFGDSISDLKTLDTLTADSQLSAFFENSVSANSGATVFFQDASNPIEIQYETVGRSGNVVQAGVVS